MVHSKPFSYGTKRWVFVIGEKHCARDTRLAGSVREREMAVNRPICSSVIANSAACRHPAMMPLLVQPTTNEESTNKPPVP
jgi:hypothetical protein